MRLQRQRNEKLTPLKRTAERLMDYFIRSEMRERTREQERRGRLEALIGGPLGQDEDKAAPSIPLTDDFFRALDDNDD